MNVHNPKEAGNFPRAAQQQISDYAHSHEQAIRARRLGDTLVKLGRLDESAIEQIVEAQKHTAMRFGATATKLGLCTPDDINAALGVQFGFLRDDLGAVALPKALTVIRQPSSVRAEEFRLMRTRLLTTKSVEQLKLFSVVSLGETGAADYAAINLAASLAQLQKQTLVLDADLRRSRLNDFFELGDVGSPGLSEVLRGAASIDAACQETIVKNLSVLTSGGRAHSPQELLACDNFRQVLAAARDAYDHVIVLAAPFGAVADGQFAWAGSKSVFVVARRDQDRHKDLKQLNVILRQLKADIIGAALIK